MQISWITKFSLIDFPWEISCIIFTPWCNFRCGFCHNSEFVLPEKLKSVYNNLIPKEIIFNFLEERKWRISGVSICWWEPTMQKELKNFCKEVKKMWFKIKIDTNGRDPKVLKEMIDEKIIDYIAMDIKYEIWKFSLASWVDVDEKPFLETIDLILKSSIDYEFRTTVVKWLHSKETINNIAKYITWAKNYYLQNYKKGNTLDKNFKWESFTEKELKEFKETANLFVENVQIRN